MSGNFNDDFRCIHCHQPVSSASLLSGVRNRNHCPYCLYSRHVDQHKVGDRLAVCQAKMKPVGLTFKKTKKKYASASSGELMLVHVCQGCGKIDINRIAADDDAMKVLELLDFYADLSPAQHTQLELNAIQILQPADRKLVRAQLFGKSG